MWGAVIVAVVTATAIAGCWGFGCCRVGWDVTKFCTKAFAVLAITTVGVLVMLFMALTILHFIIRIRS